MSIGYSVESMNATKGGQRRLRLLKPVIVKGVQGVQVGEVFLAAGDVAHDLIVNGAAEEVSEAVGNVVSTIETREPMPETRDPEIVVDLPQTPPDKSSKRKTPKTTS